MTENSSDDIAGLILHHRQRNGRSVHGNDDGYHFLGGKGEEKRLDLQHHIWYLTISGNLGLAPPLRGASTISRVLDLGTGTGIWAIDFAEEHSKTEVTAIDIKEPKPPFCPPNVTFRTMSYDDKWDFLHQFDYIHSRMANSSVKDWKRYIDNAYE
ncbi:hypothetical protein OQA88_8546 [Cercophora sp. LCS_1]